MSHGDKMALIVIGVALVSFWLGHIYGIQWCWQNKIFSLDDLRKQYEAVEKEFKKAKEEFKKSLKRKK